MTWSHRNVVLFILYRSYLSSKCFTKPFIITKIMIVLKQKFNYRRRLEKGAGRQSLPKN